MIKEYSVKSCNIEAVEFTGDNYLEIEKFGNFGSFPGIHYTGKSISYVSSDRFYSIKKGDFLIEFIDGSFSVLDKKSFNEIFKED